MENLETRVGYKALSTIRDELKEYIIIHTVDRRYVGKVEYLQTYQNIDRVLTQGGN